VIVGFISPMLKLQIHHVAYAYSLLSFQVWIAFLGATPVVSVSL
jgi:hypothetical protein